MIHLTGKKSLLFFLKNGFFPSLLYYIPIIIMYYAEAFDMKIAILCILIISVLVFPILLYIHYEYHKINKETVINTTEIKNGDNIFELKELKSIIIYKSKNNDNSDGNFRLKYLPFEDYFYMKLNFINGNCLIITCLMDEKIDKLLAEKFNDVNFLREDGVFSPFPNW